MLQRCFVDATLSSVFVLDLWFFVLDLWVFVLDQWVFVLDQWVFVLDHRVSDLRSSFLGLRFRHMLRSLVFTVLSYWKLSEAY